MGFLWVIGLFGRLPLYLQKALFYLPNFGEGIA